MKNNLLISGTVLLFFNTSAGYDKAGLQRLQITENNILERFIKPGIASHKPGDNTDNVRDGIYALLEVGRQMSKYTSTPRETALAVVMGTSMAKLIDDEFLVPNGNGLNWGYIRRQYGVTKKLTLPG